MSVLQTTTQISSTAGLTSEAILTATMVRGMIADWTDLTADRRRDLASAVSALMDIARCHPDLCGGATPETVPMECGTLNRLLYSGSPSSFGLRPDRFGNIVSGLRAVLRRLGRHAPDRKGVEGLSSAWRDLHAALPTRYRQLPLVGFMRFCHARGIEPEQVTSATLADYEAWCLTSTIDDDIGGKARRVASNWTWARVNVSGWPQADLVRPDQRDHYTLPLEAYPATFQADVQLFADHLALKDDDIFAIDEPFADDARPAASTSSRSRRRRLKPRTIETRVSAIRFAAAALVLTGQAPESLTTLRDLVSPIERVKAILSFYRDRDKRRQEERARLSGQPGPGEIRSAHAANIAETLRQIAQFHCRLPADQVDRITKWAKRVTPPLQMSMTPKNRERLRRTIEPRARAMLLHLPAELMRRASAPDLKPAEAARFAMYATVLEILLVCPLRRGNLVGLQLEHDLRRDGGRGSPITRLRIPGERVKNGHDFDWPLPAESAQQIQTYISRYRPHLTDPANPFLFPARGLGSRNASELGTALAELIEREIGVRVNPHLLRHFAIWNFLTDNPGQYELARQVLGHRTVSTTMAAYAGLEADAAARHFDDTVLESRRATRGIAMAAYRHGRVTPSRRSTPREAGR